MKLSKTLALALAGYCPWALWAAAPKQAPAARLTRKSKLNTGMWLPKTSADKP